MKRFYLLFSCCLILSAFCLGGCKTDSDVLASYNNGKITRGEFNKWLKLARIPKERVFDSIDNQKAQLHAMAAYRLIKAEALEAEFDKSDDSIRLNNFFKEAYTADFFRLKLNEKETFSEEAVSLSVIKLNVKDYAIENNQNRKLSNAELSLEYEKQIKQGAQLIEELKTGVPFKNLAEQHSDDYSKKNGGDIGYLVEGMEMYPPELIQAGFSLTEGEFTQEPIRTQGAVYIVKLDKKAVLTNKNINSLIKDKKIADQLKQTLRAEAVKKYEKQLLEDMNVVNNIQSVNFNNTNAVVYKIGDAEFTVGAFNSLFTFVLRKVGVPANEIAKVTDSQKREIAQMFLLGAVFSQEAVKTGLVNDPAYKEEWDFLYTMNLVNIYKNDVIFADIKIAPEQIYSEYQNYAARMRERNKNLRPGSRPEAIGSYAEMRPQFEKMMIEKEQIVKGREYEDALLEKADFVINENKLEKGKKPAKPEFQPEPGLRE